MFKLRSFVRAALYSMSLKSVVVKNNFITLVMDASKKHKNAKYDSVNTNISKQ